MEKAFSLFSVLGAVKNRQQRVIFHRDAQRVEHHTLCRAGMDISPAHVYSGASGIKGLHFQLAYLSAIHGIREIGSKSRHVKVFHAGPHFLIGRERDPDFPMRYLRVSRQVFHGAHNFGNAGFIIRAKQGGPVSGNQRFPAVL